MDDIVTLLKKYQPYNKLHGQAADEIERLRTEVDRWKSLCERVLDYRLGSTDWQDIRVAYEIALSDYENRKNDGKR